MMDDEADGRLQATYGANYEKLAAVKQKYDPANLFRVNQNIAPVGDRQCSSEPLRNPGRAATS
jgi:hypothetical protein